MPSSTPPFATSWAVEGAVVAKQKSVPTRTNGTANSAGDRRRAARAHVREQPPGPPRVRDPRVDRGRHRPDRDRDQVGASGQGRTCATATPACRTARFCCTICTSRRTSRATSGTTSRSRTRKLLLHRGEIEPARREEPGPGADAGPAPDVREERPRQGRARGRPGEEAIRQARLDRRPRVEA